MKNFWWHCNIKMSHVFADMTPDAKTLGKALSGDGKTTATLSGQTSCQCFPV